jgi:hypothetical protein
MYMGGGTQVPCNVHAGEECSHVWLIFQVREINMIHVSSFTAMLVDAAPHSYNRQGKYDRPTQQVV